MELDKDVAQFLEHHESVLIEASDDGLKREDSSLQNLTEGKITQEE